MHSLLEHQFRVEHQHNDGSWSELKEDHHGAPAHDPERGWVQRFFRCTSCSEVVRFAPKEQPPPAPDAE